MREAYYTKMKEIKIEKVHTIDPRMLYKLKRENNQKNEVSKSRNSHIIASKSNNKVGIDNLRKSSLNSFIKYQRSDLSPYRNKRLFNKSQINTFPI